MRAALQLSIPTLVVLALAACGGKKDAEGPEAAVRDEPAKAAAHTPSSPGNLFRLEYEIIGTPVVGSPVSVDLAITALIGDEPVDLAFRIPDATALTMDAAQPRDLRRTPSPDDRTIRERVTVIPQREGRLFINVSASRTHDAGSLTSAISIPIHVGNVDTS
jgi:hypothetical protein